MLNAKFAGRQLGLMLVFASSLSQCLESSALADTADAIVVSGTVLTMDAAGPEAEAFAVKGNRILAVGASEVIRPLAEPETLIIDARGKAVVPGFNDAHIHPSPLFDESSPLGRVPCDPAATPTMEAMIERLKRKAAQTPPGQWVRHAKPPAYGRVQNTQLI
jgi:predicted amidohydrolase YtcJ